MNKIVTDRDLIESALLLFDGFMTPEIVELNDKQRAFEVETNQGTIFGFEGFEDLIEDEHLSDICFHSTGFMYRLSASGYMDSTEWTYCENESDILDWLEEELGQWVVGRTES